MAGERIAIPPDLVQALKRLTVHKTRHRLAVESAATAFMLCGFASLIAMVWTFERRCINGQRVAPPRISEVYYYPALLLAVALTLLVASFAWKGSRARWERLVETAARARAELEHGYLDVLHLDVTSANLVADDSEFDCFLLLVPVNEMQTAAVLLPGSEEDDVVYVLKQRLRITVRPVTRSIVTMEFAGDSVTPKFAPSATFSALEQYWEDHNLELLPSGVVMDLCFDLACKLADEPARKPVASHPTPSSV